MKTIELVDNAVNTVEMLEMLKEFFILFEREYFEGTPEHMARLWENSGTALQRLASLFETLLSQAIDQAEETYNTAQLLHQKDPA